MLYDHIPVFDILTRMDISPLNFYLTGSRYFGYNNFLSDYDFIVGPTESTVADYGDVLQRLKGIGLKEEIAEGSAYLDECTISVYGNPNSGKDGISIHIQVCPSQELLEVKRTAQTLLSAGIDNMKHFTKFQQQSLWNMVISMVKGNSVEAEIFRLINGGILIPSSKGNKC